MTLRALVTAVQNIVAPPFCSGCRMLLDERSVLCDSCYAHMRPVATMMLDITKSRSMSVGALGAYEEPLVSLIRAKYACHDTAARELGQLMARALPCMKDDVDLLVPIPLHWTRYIWRGYNQADLIAKKLGKAWQLPVVPLVKRVRSTPLQPTRTARERHDNVRDVFVVDPALAHLCAGKRILLIDDLMTTGATLQAAGKALLKVKPASVAALVAARVV